MAQRYRPQHWRSAVVVALATWTLAGTAAAQSGAVELRDCRPQAPRPELVDPELAPFQADSAGAMAPRSLDRIAEYRAGFRETFARWLKTAPPAPRDVTVKTIHLPGPSGAPPIRAVVYAPIGTGKGPRPALLDIHGGSFVLGFPEMNQVRNRSLAHDLGAVVVSIDYRLAPEHPFPAALDDGYAALAWLQTQGSALGVDPRRIAVSGDSAGGVIVGGLSLLARDRGRAPIVLQTLIYAGFDDRAGGPLDATCLSGTGQPPSFGRRAYLGAAAGTNDVSPYAFVGRAPAVGGLPPTFIAAGDIDGGAGQGLAFAQRLIRAGVPVEMHVYPGAIHGFDLMAPRARVSTQFYQDLREALRRAFR